MTRNDETTETTTPRLRCGYFAVLLLTSLVAVTPGTFGQDYEAGATPALPESNSNSWASQSPPPSEARTPEPDPQELLALRSELDRLRASMANAAAQPRDSRAGLSEEILRLRLKLLRQLETQLDGAVALRPNHATAPPIPSSQQSMPPGQLENRASWSYGGVINPPPSAYPSPFANTMAPGQPGVSAPWARPSGFVMSPAQVLQQVSWTLRGTHPAAAERLAKLAELEAQVETPTDDMAPLLQRFGKLLAPYDPRAVQLHRLADLNAAIRSPGDSGRQALGKVAGMMRESNPEAARRLTSLAELSELLEPSEGSPAQLVEGLTRLLGTQDSRIGQLEDLSALGALLSEKPADLAPRALAQVAAMIEEPNPRDAAWIAGLAELTPQLAAPPADAGTAIFSGMAGLLDERQPQAAAQLRSLARLDEVMQSGEAKVAERALGEVATLFTGSQPEAAATINSLAALNGSLNDPQLMDKNAAEKVARVLRKKNAAAADAFSQLVGVDLPERNGSGGGKVFRQLALRGAANFLGEDNPELAQLAKNLADADAAGLEGKEMLKLTALQGAATLLGEKNPELAQVAQQLAAASSTGGLAGKEALLQTALQQASALLSEKNPEFAQIASQLADPQQASGDVQADLLKVLTELQAAAK